MSEDHPHNQNEVREGDVNNNKGSIRNIGIRKEHKRKKGKTDTIGMIFAKKKKNEIDIANNQSKNDDNKFMRDKSRNIGVGQQDIDRILKECQRKGDLYPPEDVLLMFKRTIEGLEVRESKVAAWSKMKVRGLFIKKGYKIRKGMVIGVYGGKITIGIGPYVLQLAYEDGEMFRVDTEGAEDGARLFGMINEDIHGGEVNAHFEEMGLIRMTENVIGPKEILTDYGDEYDWDEVKWIGYKALRDEMNEIEVGIKDMRAESMKEARKGNRLEKYMARVVDGIMDPEELHSTTPMEEGLTLEMFLTSGPRMEWFCFGNYGGERKIYDNIDINRKGKRRSGTKRYAQKWLEESTISCKFDEVRRLNEKVNTTCNMVAEMRKIWGNDRGKKGKKEKDEQVGRNEEGVKEEGEKVEETEELTPTTTTQSMDKEEEEEIKFMGEKSKGEKERRGKYHGPERSEERRTRRG